MKKTSKTFGAVALSAVLAVGCAAPAFAADPTYTGENSITTPKTDVYVEGLSDEVIAKQINITLPVDLPLSAPEAGGAFIAPSPSTYGITNNGTSKVTVDSVTGVEYPSATNPFKFVGLNAGNEPTAGTASNRTIFLTLQAGSAAPIVLTAGSQALDKPTFTIDSKGTLGLTVNGKAWPKDDGSDTLGASSKAVSLTYKVSIAA